MSNQIKYHCPVCGDIKYAYPISFIPRCEKCNRYMSEAPDETKLAFGTDNEIIKTCKNCLHYEACKGTYYSAKGDEDISHDFDGEMYANSGCEDFEDKDLINRQKEEIERLRGYNENLLKANTALSNEILDIKAAAIKEFAEIFLKKVHDNHYMLSDQINSKDYGMFTIGIEQAVNETKKEMEVEGGEQNESKSHG